MLSWIISIALLCNYQNKPTALSKRGKDKKMKPKCTNLQCTNVQTSTFQTRSITAAPYKKWRFIRFIVRFFFQLQNQRGFLPAKITVQYWKVLISLHNFSRELLLQLPAHLQCHLGFHHCYTHLNGEDRRLQCLEISWLDETLISEFSQAHQLHNSAPH